MAEVPKALDVFKHSLCACLERFCNPAEQQHEESALQAVIRYLKAELCQMAEERNLLKEAATYFARESRKGSPANDAMLFI